MKGTKLWAMFVFAAILVSCVVIAFAKQGVEVIQTELSQVRNRIQPPENATIVDEIGTVYFDLSLNTREVTVAKGQSLNMSVTVSSMERVDLKLMALNESDSPTLSSTPELPLGINAHLDRTEITVEEGSEVIVNLTLSISDQAASGIYRLRIYAVQKTNFGEVGTGKPLQLTIP